MNMDVDKSQGCLKDADVSFCLINSVSNINIIQEGEGQDVVVRNQAAMVKIDSTDVGSDHTVAESPAILRIDTLSGFSFL